MAKKEKDPTRVRLGKRSKVKGAVGEREAAAVLTDLFGVSFKRGVQYKGGPDSPDVTTAIPGIHIEVKRVENLSVHKAIAQSKEEAAEEEIPTVIHRKNRTSWLLTIELKDLPKLSEVIYKFQEANNGSCNCVDGRENIDSELDVPCEGTSGSSKL